MNKDERVYKSVGKITIPTQLSEFPGARFILIDKVEGRGKKPKERKWTTEKNYNANEPKLLGHIRGGGNYGIATGLGWLHCFDVDEVERLRELGILDKLPATLTVKTGGGGLHYWYRIEGLKKRTILYDMELKDRGNEDQYLHLGEIQSMGNYAIGPNCIHHSGNRYEIINDAPIADLDYQLLLDIIKPLRTKKKDDRPATVARCAEGQHSLAEVELDRIAWPDGNVQKKPGSSGGIEYQGSNPFHGSEGGQNFSVNPSKGVWCCYRCSSGGGWQELLAVKEGIITCAQAGKGCLTKKQRREVFQRAEELGLIKEQVVDAPIKEIELDREIVEEIPREVPNGDMVLVVAPPRTGKTHKVVTWLDKNGSGNYITHTHAIVEHAIKIASELKMRSVVWVVGLSQPTACINGGKERDCTHCPLAHTNENHFEIEREAVKLLKEKGILTPANVPKQFCPYYILKAAEKHARYCFTVVNNINTIIPRDFVVLDEEPVLSYFYPTSIEVATVKNRAGDERNQNHIVMSASLQQDMENILNHKKSPKLFKVAKKLKEISDIIENGRDEGLDAEKIAEDIEDTLIGFEPGIINVDSDSGNDDGDELTLDQCARCFGKLYRDEEKSTVSLVRKGGGYQSIYILGDERETAYGTKWMENATKIIIIGATKAELFIKEFGGREITVEKFRYDNRFQILGVDVVGDDGTDRGRGTAQKRNVLEIASAAWNSPDTKTRHPFMILTGSKKEQESVAKRIPGSIQIRKEREMGMEWTRLSGAPAVLYQNSVISRGLDVDQYNLMFVYGCNFAQPFWSVADPGIAAAIISDETTNSVLRISSTLRTDKETMKLVIMRKDDVGKVKYLSNMRIISESPGNIAKMINALGVAGSIEIDGRSKIESKSIGTNYEQGKAKLIELVSGRDEAFDENEVQSVIERILGFMAEKKRERRKVISTNDIYKSIKTRSGKSIIAHSLQQLYSSGKLVLKTHGKNKNWSLK